MAVDLDQIIENLNEISNLLEAKRRRPKVKFGPRQGDDPFDGPPIGGRKGKKLKKNLASFYSGTTDPDELLSLNTSEVDTADVLRGKGKKPKKRRKAAAPKVVPPEVEKQVPVTPRTPVAAAPPPKPLERPVVPSIPSPSERLKAAIPSLAKAGRTVIAKPKELAAKLWGLFSRYTGKRSIKESGLRTMYAMALVEERSSTTFKRCPRGAMVSTPYLRHSLPLNTFVNPREDFPTFPIRPDCRASLAGLGRALQRDMSGADRRLVSRVIALVNRLGGIKGKARIRLWGTGVGGKRMETYRGKPHTPKRTHYLAKKLGISKRKAAKLYGTSTGRPDMIKHTIPYSPVGGTKGPAGQREVPRAELAHAKPKRKLSRRKAGRIAAGRAVTAARGRGLIGRRPGPHVGEPITVGERDVELGKSLAAKFAAKKGANKGKKGKRGKKRKR